MNDLYANMSKRRWIKCPAV